MAISPMSNRPACLHIPELHEGSPATVSWAKVNETDEYEIECAFDESFSNLERGVTWGEMHDLDKTWFQIGDTLPWDDPSLSAYGTAWYGIQSGNISWADGEYNGFNWGELHKLPPRFTVYKGEGDTFGAHEDGGGWENLNAKSLDWSEVHDVVPTWQGLDNCGKCGVKHLYYTAQMPINKKTVSFRARARKSDGTVGDYITSAQLPIIPIFYRNDIIEINAEKGDDFYLQLHTRHVESDLGVPLTLDYSPYYLRLSESLPHLSYGMHMGDDFDISLKRFSQKEGRIKFQWPDKTGLEISVLLFHVKILHTGRTKIKFY